MLANYESGNSRHRNRNTEKSGRETQGRLL